MCWCIISVQCVRMLFTHNHTHAHFFGGGARSVLVLQYTSVVGSTYYICMCVFCTWVLLLYCATLFSWSTKKGWKMSRWKSEGRAVNTSRSSPTSRTRERDDGCTGDKFTQLRLHWAFDCLCTHQWCTVWHVMTNNLTWRHRMMKQLRIDLLSFHCLLFPHPDRLKVSGGTTA